MQIAIECKNDRKTTGIERVEAFSSKLRDVGIPRGIYVSTRGFTAPARARAASDDIRLLTLEGLTADRLNAAISDALQSIVFLVPRTETFSRFDNADPSQSKPADWLEIEIDSSFGNGLPAIYEAVWQLWRDGSIPARIGEHVIFITLPPEFRYSKEEDPVENGVVVALIKVLGFAKTWSGVASSFVLRDADSGAAEQIRVEVTYPAEPELGDLFTVHSEAELSMHLAQGGVPHVWKRIKSPRLATAKLYWPPSARAIFKARELQQQGQDVTFANVEGYDVSVAWELPARQGPS
jgi:hypothetical protein